MLTLQRTLLVLFSTALAIILLITAGATYNAKEQRHNYELSREGYQRLLMMETLIVTMLEAESSQRAFLITGDSLYLNEYQALRELLTRYRSVLENLELRPSYRQNNNSVSGQDNIESNLLELPSLITTRLELLDEGVLIFQSEGADAVANLIRSSQGKLIMDNIRRISSAITAMARDSLEDRDLIAEHNATRLIWFLAAGALVNLLLLVCAFAFTSKSLNHGRSLMLKLQSTSDEIASVNQLSSSLQSCNTVSDSASILEHFGRQLFPHSSGGIYLIRASRNLLELATSWNDIDSPMVDPLEPNDCWALRMGKTYEINGDGQNLRCTHLSDTDRYHLCLPLMAQSDIVGLFSIEVAEDTDLSEVRIRAEMMATHVSASLASINLREALRHQSIRDPLTGLFNRRYLEEAMEREILRSKRSQSPISVMMIDIDRFKLFNDTHGHQAGDAVLTEFAEYLRGHLRAEDIVCRYGGEEFLVVMPGVDAVLAQERAESLRQNLVTLKVHFRGQSLPVFTASFGISSFPEHGQSTESLIRSADAALYLAKGSGRNCVKISSENNVGPIDPERLTPEG